MNNITDSPFKSISILYRKTHIWLNNSCSKYGLTAPQAVIILIVCDFNGLTQDEITKRLGLDKSVIAKTVTKLIKSGFMIRQTNAKDKRTYDILPTEEAWKVYPFVKEQIDNCFLKLTKHMDDSQRKEFKHLLQLASEAVLSEEE